MCFPGAAALCCSFRSARATNCCRFPEEWSYWSGGANLRGVVRQSCEDAFPNIASGMGFDCFLRWVGRIVLVDGFWYIFVVFYMLFVDLITIFFMWYVKDVFNKREFNQSITVFKHHSFHSRFDSN